MLLSSIARIVIALCVVTVAASPLFAIAAPLPQLKLLVPAHHGADWDQTARAMERTLRDEKLVSGAVRIINRGGAGGTIGLAELAKAKGNGTALMVTGFAMVGAIQTNKSPVTLEAVTPIARLTNEYLVIVVPAPSKIQSLKDFTDAVKKDPAVTTIAGGVRGGADHILAALVAESVGVPAAKVSYVAFAGGAEAVAALLGGQVAAGIGSYGEVQAHVESKRLRVLGISAPARVANTDVPTLKEQGVNVDFGNWRGVVAPAGITAGDRKSLMDTIDRMAKSGTWKSELRKHHWDDAYLGGDAYGSFLRAENDRISRVLKDVGLVK